MAHINKIALVRKVRLLIDEIMDMEDIPLECKFSHVFGALELGMLSVMERANMSRKSQKEFLGEMYKRMMR
jgi:hypothetical protein